MLVINLVQFDNIWSYLVIFGNIWSYLIIRGRRRRFKGRLEFFQNFIQFVPLILLYTSPHKEIHPSIHPHLSVHLLHQGATSVWDGIIGRAFISAALFDATQTLFGCSVTPTNNQPTAVTTTKKRRDSVMVQTPLLWQARCGFLLKEIMPSWV